MHANSILRVLSLEVPMERSLKAIADRLRERIAARRHGGAGRPDVVIHIEDILSADWSRTQMPPDSQVVDPVMATMLPPTWTMASPWEARCTLCTRVIESGAILLGGLGYCSFECASSAGAASRLKSSTRAPRYPADSSRSEPCSPRRASPAPRLRLLDIAGVEGPRRSVPMRLPSRCTSLLRTGQPRGVPGRMSPNDGFGARRAPRPWRVGLGN